VIGEIGRKSREEGGVGIGGLEIGRRMRERRCRRGVCMGKRGVGGWEERGEAGRSGEGKGLKW